MTNSRSKPAIWLRCSLLALVVAACSSRLGPETDSLADARARWDAREPVEYSFSFRRGCFCGPDYIREMSVRVRDGQVVSAVYVDGDEPTEPAAELVPTIDALLDEIEEAIERDAHELLATYDDEFGYPLEVSIDYILQAVDEEMYFQVRDFEVIANGS
ncbi:MAG: DUF6174 domain-containing protein [Gemmatimonadota bacterium]|nr:DUF6174 domain-containing protein [Gemmatimonadota bacterium]